MENGHFSSDIGSISELQEEVLIQSKDIEKYIDDMKQKKSKSETFTFLQTLFKLFKVQVKINFDIRQTLIKQNEFFNEQKKKSNSKNFFRELSALSSVQVNDFPRALELYNNLYSEVVSKRNRFKEEIKELKEDNKTLVKLVQSEHNKLIELEKAFEERNGQRTEIESALQDAEVAIGKLTKDLFDTREQLNIQIRRNEELLKLTKVAENNKESAINSIKEEYEMIRQTMDLNNKSKEKIIDEKQREIDSLTSTLKMKEDELSTYRQKLESTNSRDNELHRLISSFRNQVNDLNEQLLLHQCQLAFQNGQNEVIQEKYEKLEEENISLKKDLNEVEQNTIDSNAYILRLKEQVKILKKQYECDMNKVNKEHEDAMKEINNEYEDALNRKDVENQQDRQKKETMISKLNKDIISLTEKLKNCEKSLNHEKNIVSRYKLENERLRNKMRQNHL